MSFARRNLLRFGRSALFGRPNAIGIDFDSSHVHWAQFDRVGGSVRIRDACSIRFQGGPEALLASRSDLKRMVSEVLRRGRFKGRRVVTHTPAADTRLMLLNYTEDNTLSEEGQILGLARERMRDDLLAHVVDYVPIRTSGDQQGERSALVAVAREEAVIEHLERLRRAGLHVEALEIPPVAIRRLIANSLPTIRDRDQHGLVMILRLGIDTTELTLLSGRRLLLYRELDIGAESMIEAIAKGLDCEPDAAAELVATYGVGEFGGDNTEAFEFADSSGEGVELGDIAATLREIVRPCMRLVVEQSHKAISYAAFQTRGMSIDRIYLIPGSIRCPGLDGLLGEMLQLPVDLFQPMVAIPGADEWAGTANAEGLSLALGFALRGVADA